MPYEAEVTSLNYPPPTIVWTCQKKQQYTREKCMNLLRKRKEKKKVVFQLGDRQQAQCSKREH
jgi:hypothetical protein